jgi:VanZ family protein
MNNISFPCKIKWKSLLFWSIVVIWMIMIFSLSSQPAQISNANSESFTKVFLNATKSIHKIDVDRNSIESKNLISNVNNILRNYAHAGVFLILAILVFAAVKSLESYSIKKLIFSFSICLIYSISDEIHQLFIPGRAFQLSDLGLDLIGIVLGISISIVVSQHIDLRKEQ